MAISVKFEGFNSTMVPEALSLQKIGRAIYCFRDGQQVISCWRLTQAELDEIAATGVVWLALRGNDSPDLRLSGSALVNVGKRHAKPIEIGRPKKSKNSGK